MVGIPNLIPTVDPLESSLGEYGHRALKKKGMCLHTNRWRTEMSRIAGVLGFVIVGDAPFPSGLSHGD